MKASIRRKLVLGVRLTMIESYTEQIIAGELVTTKFEDGSWLYFPKASDSEETESGFIIRDTFKDISYCLKYEFSHNLA